MDFTDHKPIYLQISDTICDKILAGTWAEEDRIPSVREYGAQLGVNPNTIMRAYEHLQTNQIIYNKRGIGYFINTGARDIIVSIQQNIFLQEEVPKIKRKMELLNLKASDIF